MGVDSSCWCLLPMFSLNSHVFASIFNYQAVLEVRLLSHVSLCKEGSGWGDRRAGNGVMEGQGMR